MARKGQTVPFAPDGGRFLHLTAMATVVHRAEQHMGHEAHAPVSIEADEPHERRQHGAPLPLLRLGPPKGF
jgi:hypothetical protein